METRKGVEERDVGRASTIGALSGVKDIDHSAIEANTVVQLTLREFVINIETHASYTTTIRLPSVSEARGKMYALKLVTDGTADATIQCYGDSDDAYGWADLTLGTAGEGYLLYSDGQSWWQLATAF